MLALQWGEKKMLQGGMAISHAHCWFISGSLSSNTWPHVVLLTPFRADSTDSVGEVLPLSAAVSGKGSMWTHTWRRILLSENKVFLFSLWGLYIVNKVSTCLDCHTGAFSCTLTYWLNICLFLHFSGLLHQRSLFFIPPWCNKFVFFWHTHGIYHTSP